MKDQTVLLEKSTDRPIIGIDIETSGQYPIQDDIVEIAAVKTLNGQVIDTFQTLIKPRALMGDFIISIHGITNEMVADAPHLSEVLPKFAAFVSDGVIVGHHSPFDLGFLVYEMEKYNLPLSNFPALCSSLIARNSIVGTPNHKLQTLVQHLGLQGGQAHRALSDSHNSLQLLFECFRRKNVETFADAFRVQGSPLWWQDFSIRGKCLGSQNWKKVLEAIESNKSLEIIYNGGTFKGKLREVKPVSIVCSPTGDFMVAFDPMEPGPSKRFYLNRLKEAEILP